jgi:hypothetical protein
MATLAKRAKRHSLLGTTSQHLTVSEALAGQLDYVVQEWTDMGPEDMLAFFAHDTVASLLDSDIRRSLLTLLKVPLGPVLVRSEVKARVVGVQLSATAIYHIDVNLSVYVDLQSDGLALSVPVVKALYALGIIPEGIPVRYTDYMAFHCVNDATPSPDLLKVIGKYIQEFTCVPPFVRPFQDRSVLLDLTTWRLGLDPLQRRIPQTLWFVLEDTDDRQVQLHTTVKDIEAIAESIASVPHPVDRKGCYRGAVSSVEGEELHAWDENAFVTPLINVSTSTCKLDQKGLYLYNIRLCDGTERMGKGITFKPRQPQVQLAPLPASCSLLDNTRVRWVDSEAVDDMSIMNTMCRMYDYLAGESEATEPAGIKALQLVMRLFCLHGSAWTAVRDASSRQYMQRYRAAVSPDTKEVLTGFTEFRRRRMAREIISTLDRNAQGKVLVMYGGQTTTHARLSARLARAAAPSGSKRAMKDLVNGSLKRVVFGQMDEWKTLIVQPWLAIVMGDLPCLIETTAMRRGALVGLTQGAIDRDIPLYFIGNTDIERELVVQALLPTGVLSDASVLAVARACRLA